MLSVSLGQVFFCGWQYNSEQNGLKNPSCSETFAWVDRINVVVLFIFQTFRVGCELHALFTPSCAEESVFVTINKEKPGIVN